MSPAYWILLSRDSSGTSIKSGNKRKTAIVMPLPSADLKNVSAPYSAISLGNLTIKTVSGNRRFDDTKKNKRDSSSIQRLQYLALEADCIIRLPALSSEPAVLRKTEDQEKIATCNDWLLCVCLPKLRSNNLGLNFLLLFLLSLSRPCGEKK
jgi:hypothetical protein